MNPDPYRALDPVEPPDQWADIVDRAAHDPIPQRDLDGSPGRRRLAVPLLAAAAVIVLVVVAVVVRSDGDGPRRSRTVDAPPTEPQGPQAIIGHQYRVIALSDAGKQRPFAGKGLPSFTFDGKTVSFTGCNGGAAPAHLDGSTLVTEAPFTATLMRCEQPLLDQDAWIQRLLAARPTVLVTGPRAVLTAGARSIELYRFVDATPSPLRIEVSPGPLGQEGATVTVAEGDPLDGLCATIGSGATCSASDASPRTVGDQYGARTGSYAVGRFRYYVLYGYLPPGASAAQVKVVQGGPEAPTTNHDGLWAAMLGSTSGNGGPGAPGSASFAATVEFTYPQSPAAAVGDPKDVIGPTWLVTSLTDRDGPVPLASDRAPTFTVTSTQAAFHGCIEVVALAHLEDDRLVTRDGISSEQRCPTPSTSMTDQQVAAAEAAQGRWLAAFISRDPTVVVRGDELQLVAGEQVVWLHR